MFKSIARLAVSLAAAGVFVALLVEGMSCATWRLSGAGTVDVRRLAGQKWDWRPDTSSPTHQVSEWAGPRHFREAPTMAELVRQGKLPPVEQRLPANPLVVAPPQRIGPYGGLWTRYAERPNHVFISNYYLANNSLLRWNPHGDGSQLNFAADWPSVQDGGRTYTIKLRQGVRWSDGSPLTADDVLFWYHDIVLNRELTPTLPQNWCRGGEPAELEKLDDFTIRFRFKEPHGLFLNMLAHGTMAGGAAGFQTEADMLSSPRHYLSHFHPKYASGDKLAAMIAEKGFSSWTQLFSDRADWRNPQCPRISPWVLKEPPSSSRPILYVRNPYYWKVDPQGNQLPYIDAVEYHVYDANVIAFKVLAGQIGFQDRFVRFEDYPLYVERGQKEGYRPRHWLGSHGNGYVLAFNLNHKDPVLRDIFNKKEFRIAMSHAINRRELIEIGSGVGIPRQVCPPRASPYYTEAAKAYETAYTEYDPELSRKLLASIGLTRRDKDGILLRPDGKPLRIRLETSREGVTHELICEYFTAVGVKTDLKLEHRDLFYQRKAALMHDLAMWVGADEFLPTLDPRWFFPLNDESLQAIGWARWFQSDGARGEEPPPEVRKCMELYRQITQTVDEQSRKELFDEIIRLNHENLWVIGTTGEGAAVVLVRDNFHNVPQACINGAAWRTPGNAAPECWSISEAN